MHPPLFFGAYSDDLGFHHRNDLSFNSTAYYIAWAPQILAKDFPQAHVAKRDLYIIQPANFSWGMVQQLRSVANKGAKILLYFDFLNLPLYVKGSCATGHVMGDKTEPPRVCETPEQPYYHCGQSSWQEYFQKSFTPESMAREVCPDKSPQIICQYPGLAAHVWSEEKANKASDLLLHFVYALGADGVYLDGYCNSYIRYEVLQALYNTVAPGCGVDVNGDGKGETISEALAQATGWGQYFVATLREHLGSNHLILGNAGGVNSDAFLNGVTVEMEYCTDGALCKSAFASSRRTTEVNGLVPISVAWLKSPATFPPEKQCAFAKELQQDYPWVLIGVDIFDGEPVFCGF